MNQFELPVLFHTCCIALYVTQGVDLLTLALAWVFAVLRYVHAYVHLTSNRVRLRSMVFRVGSVVLLALWVAFAVHIAGIA